MNDNDQNITIEELEKQAEEAERKAKALREQAEQAKKAEEIRNQKQLEDQKILRQMHNEEPELSPDQKEILKEISNKAAEEKSKPASKKPETPDGEQQEQARMTESVILNDRPAAQSEERAEKEEKKIEEDRKPETASAKTAGQMKTAGSPRIDTPPKAEKKNHKITVGTGAMVGLIALSACLGALSWGCGYTNFGRTATKENSSYSASVAPSAEHEQEQVHTEENETDSQQGLNILDEIRGELAGMYGNSVVSVRNTDANGEQRYCTGIVTGVDHDYYYIAVPSVAAEEGDVHLMVNDLYPLEATVAQVDTTNSIAILKVKTIRGMHYHLKPIKAHMLADADINDKLFTIYKTYGNKTSIELCNITGVNSGDEIDNDAFINETDIFETLKLGGLLTDADGNIICMLNIADSEGDSISYSAISANALIDATLNVQTSDGYTIVEEDDASGDEESDHGYLGIVIQNIETNNDAFHGVYVAGVLEGTDAYESGIRTGDIITEVNGYEISAPSDVIEMVDGLAEGDTVLITYIEGSGKGKVETHTTSVTLSGDEVSDDLNDLTESINQNRR